MKSVILGTAQWGLDYGATNAAGRLSDAALSAVVNLALDLGIGRLDTAPAYGDAETRIGSLATGFEIQTKVSALAAPGGGLADMRASLQRSLARLGRPSVASVLIHDWPSVPESLRGTVALGAEELRAEGLCSTVGVSAYAECEVAFALASFACLDTVQLPASILDQRLVGSPVVAAARADGTRIQARSLFLQGAALAGASHGLFGSHPDVMRLRASDAGALRLCLGWARAQDWIDELVLGVASADELEELMGALSAPVALDDWASFASTDEWLIDPRRWTAPTGAGLGQGQHEGTT